MIKKETVGILTNPDGFLWVIELTQGQVISVGIEEFEGKLIKLTRTNEKIIIEILAEVEPIPWEQFHKVAKELCVVEG